MTSTAPLTPMQMPFTDHPCFDLPVAPRCNVQCNYCNRKYDCVSESRPGVTSTVLTPEQAADYVDTVRRDIPNLAVVGIAGPGDPFANADKTLSTLWLVKERHPDLLLCVSSNGLGVPRHLDEIAELGISHVTITMSAIDPDVAAKVYRWVRDGRGEIYRGREAGELLISRQLESIRGLKERGVTVKVNTVLVPGVTLEGIADVAKKAAELGADVMNAMPLYPVDGTPFGELDAPTAAEITEARSRATPFIMQMTHCQRCRADAVGMLDDEHDDDAVNRLLAARSPAKNRPYVAVCTQEGYLINQHLGGADHVLVYENANIDGRVTPRLVDKRTTPPPGGGAARWAHLAGLLSDCKALICYQLGDSPRMVLQGSGISVHESDSLITDAVTDIFAGRQPRRALPPRDCVDSCAGPGTGCG
jgi:nitrogen fixation protein NifB